MSGEKPYEEVDELLMQIRLLLLKVRQSDPTTAYELKSLFNQLELWFESLVADSQKLIRLERLVHGTTEMAKRLHEKLGGDAEIG